MMVITQNAGVTYSIFPNISKTELTRHGCSTRLGGVSDGIYKSMNLGYKRGDDTDNVTANFRGFTQALGVNLEDTVFCAQVHGAN
ncbi:MAG: polyphenol oxidase family protein, partial [Clostridiales bacterium]|nr:polyphenol oxidase family protein [Clostridiales bacterium]